MTYESLNRIGPRIVFSETFTSEQDTRRNGGVPTDVVFQDGKGLFDGSSYIVYPTDIGSKFGGVTWKGKVKFNNAIGNIEVIATYGTDALNTGHNYILQRLATGKLEFFTVIGTSKAEGTTTMLQDIRYDVAFTHTTTGLVSLFLDGKLEATETGVSGASLTGINFVLGRHSQVTARYLVGEIDLFEIFYESWTAEQVSNDYNNSTYKDIRDGLVLDVDSRQGVIEDKFGNTITNTGVEIKRDGEYYVSLFSGGAFDELDVSNNITSPTAITVNIWAYQFDNAIQERFFELFGGVTAYTMYRNTAVQTISFISGSGNIVIFPTLKHKWRMYTIVFTSGGTYGYLNGVLEDSAIGAQTLPDITTIYFGNKNGGVKQFKGKQNQQRIYNRALSAEEVMQLFTSQKGSYNV